MEDKIRYKLYSHTCKTFSTKKEEKEINYSEIFLPYFPSNVYETKPIGNISLQQFLDSHKNPRPQTVQVLQEIEEASQKGDTKTKDELKRNSLYYFTPTVQLEIRSYNGIQAFNPVMVAEYDKVGETQANKLKEAIFKRFNSCICAYLSPSRQGVKFLFRIPVVKTVDEYKEYFYGLCHYLSQIQGFDTANQNPTLPLFISYDRDMLIRPEEEVETWETRGYNMQSFKVFTGDFEPVQGTKEEKDIVLYNIRTAIERIHDNAHPKVVALSASIGGYVAAGYISEQEAISYLHEKISENEYMSKNTAGYKRTATEMVKRGQSSPLFLT